VEKNLLRVNGEQAESFLLWNRATTEWVIENPVAPVISLVMPLVGLSVGI
jgi:hypothetical protein